MKNAILWFHLILVLSCQSDDMTEAGDSAPQQTGESSYDPNLIPPKDTPANNLLANSSFESDGDWFLCGDAAIETSPQSISGSKTMVLGNRTVCEAADDAFFTTRNAIVIQTLPIAELPDVMTVSFWIKTSTGIPEDAFRVYLTNEPEKFLNSLAGGDALISYFDETTFTNEWSQIKLFYERDDTNLFIRNDGTLSLVFQLEPSKSYDADILLELDDIKVSEGTEQFTQPEPLPEALVSALDTERILFRNLTNGTISSMRSNGDDVVNYTGIPTDLLAGIPSWYDAGVISVTEKTFNPLTAPDPGTISASGTNVKQYPIKGGEATTVYQTFGEPGLDTGLPDNPNNKEAIDIEVRRMAWNKQQNLGALTICARSRFNLFTSDDVCNIVLVNRDTFEEVGTIQDGFNAVWSSTGRLAYYWDNAIFISELSNGTSTGREVYRNTAISGLLQEVDWSPDGNKLVFAEKGNGAGFINGSFQTFYTIKTLDVNTNKVEVLLLVDHGMLSTNLSWSPDGQYIFYSLTQASEQTKIWWLEVATGRTGPLTTKIDAASAYWLK
ncbi:MAG: hypothetical protein AAFU57_07535 [Bacteroidota bacterium]